MIDAHLNPSAAFRYQLLGRLKHDCDHYLGFGSRNPKRLWAMCELEQIATMKALHASLPEQPEWLTAEQLQAYEAQMLRARAMRDEMADAGMAVA